MRLKAARRVKAKGGRVHFFLGLPGAGTGRTLAGCKR